MDGTRVFHARDEKVIQNYTKDVKEWYNLRLTEDSINMDLKGMGFECVD
jgi:hypothetical protein